MFKVPSLLLKQLYTFNSLTNLKDSVQLTLKNRLSDAKLLAINSVKIDGNEVPADSITVNMGDDWQSPAQIKAKSPIDFPLRQIVDIRLAISPLAIGKHKLEIKFETKPFGKLTLKVDDVINEHTTKVLQIPRDRADDYGEKAIKARQAFVESFTGHKFEHVQNYSFDPHITAGNCEHFTGVAQIPLGIAGPIKINGEHAQGEFLIPMATAEGTLVASYNRGIKLMNRSGGVKCTISGDVMQRAPVFVFADARDAREFVAWVQANKATIAQHGEATSSVAKLDYIDPFLANKFAFLRFNFKTGDAAGQNMVGRATFAACSWILDKYDAGKIKHFYLESNLATDKKASQINVMRTRGKRVTAEITIKRNHLIETMRVEPEALAYHYGIANVGAILSGANNNGLHSANGITAMFIATGQDVANVAESSAAILYAELTPEKDLHISITIPSLIVATFGGGTSLATQQDCLKMIDCVGRGKVGKLTEIIAGVVLAGEISLAAAIASSDWVSSHEQYGRNR